MKLPEELQFMANSRIPPKRTGARLDGRTCVITGATSGVGYAAARELAAAGAKIVLIARNGEKAARVAAELSGVSGVSAEYVLADFTDLDAVRRAAFEVLCLVEEIHLLVNSAGIHVTKRSFTDGGIETVLCVNHLAPFLLTRLLLDRIVGSAPARIIQVNSEGHRFCGFDPDDLEWSRRFYTGLRSYGASKSAQLLTVWEFADRLRGSGVTINAMHPGAVRSAIGMNNGALYRFYSRVVVGRFLKDPSISADAIRYLAADPSLRETSGLFFNLTTPEIPAAHARDRDLGKRVWDVSERITGGEYSA